MKHSFFNPSKLFLSLFSILLKYSIEVNSQEIQMETTSISKGPASPKVMDVKLVDRGLFWDSTSNKIQQYQGFIKRIYRNININLNSLKQNSIFNLTKVVDLNLWITNELRLIFYCLVKSTLKNFNIDSTFQVVWTSRTPQVLPDSQKII